MSAYNLLDRTKVYEQVHDNYMHLGQVSKLNDMAAISYWIHALIMGMNDINLNKILLITRLGGVHLTIFITRIYAMTAGMWNDVIHLWCKKCKRDI